MYKIGFIGAGNMGSALVMAAAKEIGGSNILIFDHNQSKMDKLVQDSGCVIAESEVQIAYESEYIVLAVKPNVIRNAASSIAPILAEHKATGIKHIVITIAAGVTIDTISQCIANAYPVIRLMPNTPVAIGKGTTLYTYSDEVPQDIIQEFLQIMSHAGSFEYIAETKFDITSSISGCAPAYVYMFIEALADGAVEVGVPRNLAIKLAAQTVMGSAAMVLESGKHPEQLKDDVCSPGGSTIAGVSALEANGFRYAAAQSIVKSTEKNCKLGK